MKANDVTLGENAQAWCRKLGVPEAEIRDARVSGSESAGTEFLAVYSGLSDGTRVRLKCPHDRPLHVLSWRPIIE